MRISDIYSPGVEFIGLEQTAREAAGKMRETRASMLVVLAQNGTTPIGVVTDRDLVLKVLATGAAPQAVPVGDLMSRDVATCRASQSLFDAVQIMRRYGVRRLPVMDDDGSVRGVVSADDIYAALATHMRELSHAMVREQLRELESSL